MDDPEYFECRCHSAEHTLRLWLEDEDDDPCVFVSVFLSNDVWYRRVWAALKYACGYKSRYGHFDEFIIRPEDCQRMISILMRLKEANKKNGRH